MFKEIENIFTVVLHQITNLVERIEKLENTIANKAESEIKPVENEAVKVDETIKSDVDTAIKDIDNEVKPIIEGVETTAKEVESDVNKVI